MRGHTRHDGLLADFCDGSAYSSHPLYSAHPEALQIILYYDDVEVCNPIGSKSKQHKLGKISDCTIIIMIDVSYNTALFYYTLGNISPRF